MNEQLPNWLQMAVNEPLKIAESNRKMGPLDQGTFFDRRAVALSAAADAIRAEYDQRLTLQHHACDQAQHIADLERHISSLISESEAKIPAMQAAFEERLTLDRANRLLVKRIADLETKCDTLKRLHDAAADERDEFKRIASAYSPQKELSTALEQAKASGRQARKERDELRARLAEIEAQEPVAFTLRFAGNPRINPETTYRTQRRADEYADDCAACGSDPRPIVTPLYARPVPAQAVPMTPWRFVDAMGDVKWYGDQAQFLQACRAIETAVLAANNLEVRRG